MGQLRSENKGSTAEQQSRKTPAGSSLTMAVLPKLILGLGTVGEHCKCKLANTNKQPKVHVSIS